MIWCGAAKEYAAYHKLMRDPCAVIPVPIDHANTKSIGAHSGRYIDAGFRLLERAKIAMFRHHACSLESTSRTSGHGCIEHSHRWFTSFATLACEAKEPPKREEELEHVRRCAALSFDGCDGSVGGGGGGGSRGADGGDSSRGGGGGHAAAMDAQHACGELRSLYEPSPPPTQPKSPVRRGKGAAQ